MSVMGILRKLGILRFGSASGRFKNYQEMPDELMFDNVYDAEKDLTTKEDLKKFGKFMKGSNGSGSDMDFSD